MDGHAVSFGPFRLLAAQRLLLEGDQPVRLGSRAFDILAALVERAGDVVGKEQLIARAWPQTFVEVSNLKIQVSALRRADAPAAPLLPLLSRQPLAPYRKFRPCFLHPPSPHSPS